MARGAIESQPVLFDLQKLTKVGGVLREKRENIFFLFKKCFTVAVIKEFRVESKSL